MDSENKDESSSVLLPSNREDYYSCSILNSGLCGVLPRINTFSIMFTGTTNLGSVRNMNDLHRLNIQVTVRLLGPNIVYSYLNKEIIYFYIILTYNLVVTWTSLNFYLKPIIQSTEGLITTYKGK